MAQSAENIPEYPYRGNVAGGGYQEPGFALLTGSIDPDGVTSPTTYITAPSGFKPKWEVPKYTYTAPNGERTEYHYYDRLRFTLLVRFDVIDKSIRDEMLKLANHNINGSSDRLIRVWPHKDVEHIYFDCSVESMELDKYLRDTPIGYGNLWLKFRAQETITEYPDYVTPTYFTDTDVEDPGSNYAYFYDSDVEEDDDYKTTFYDRDVQP